MSILLFAALIDYSLFVFSRYREELNKQENQFEAMKIAMQSTAKPVLFAAGTVLTAMVILIFAGTQRLIVKGKSLKKDKR